MHGEASQRHGWFSTRGWNIIRSCICMERLLKDMADCLLEVGTCSGHVCMERLLKDMTDCLLDVGTCSGHVYAEPKIMESLYFMESS